MPSINNFINKLFVGNSLNKLKQLPSNSIDLIITSPPYWNAVTYDKDVKADYDEYLNNLTKIFFECARLLRPNGKIAINTPIMPIPKSLIKQDLRHLKDISADLSDKILNNINLNFFSLYIWQKQTSKLMFGSYPYPGNLLENNTTEFIRIYVKPGKSKKYPQYIKDNEKLKKHEWIDLIQQVWFMIPEDISRKKNHPAPFPEKLPARLMRMFSYGSVNSFEGDIILDPFVGTGTTCVVAKKMNRRFVGIDISASYIEHARGRLYKAKENARVNCLVGKTSHESKNKLDETWEVIKKSRNRKVDGERLEKLIKKNREIKFGRDLKKKKEQNSFEF
jgi:DNA modification methylase